MKQLSFNYILILLGMLFMAGGSSAQITTQPTGLKAGDSYRLIFVTSGTFDITLKSVADVNTHVTNTVAALPALSSLRATWTAIFSDGSTDARDNTESNTNNVDHVSAPIYNLKDLKVVDGNADLWDGDLDNGIEFNEDGVSAGSERVRTHTSLSGVLAGSSYGNASATGWTWTTWSAGGPSATIIYGISSVITIRPKGTLIIMR